MSFCTFLRKRKAVTAIELRMWMYLCMLYMYLLYLCMCVHNETDAFCNCLLPNVINAILTHFSVERKQKSKLITWQQSPFDPPSPLLHNAHVQHTGPSVCVSDRSSNIFHPHVGWTGVATSSLPQPTFALFFTCPTCGTYLRRCSCNCATVVWQLDSSTALDSLPTLPAAWLAISCGSIDLRFEYPKLAHFRSVTRP